MTPDWMDRADSTIRAAKLLYDGGYWGHAVGRAYYAMHYAARAVILHETPGGSLAKTHAGLINQFGMAAIAGGELSRDQMRLLGRGFETRLVADYEVEAISEETAEETLTDARRFIASARTAIG